MNRPTEVSVASQATDAKHKMSGFIRAISGVLLLGYPALIYFGITLWSPRRLGFTISACALLMFASKLVGAPRDRMISISKSFVFPVALGLGAGIVGDPRFLLFLPVAINASLAISFVASLRAGSAPMLQRFAELQRARADEVIPLSPSALAHCRSWTAIWASFLVVNALIPAGLALGGNLTWWANYTCFISYVLLGALFFIEKSKRPADKALPDGLGAP